MAPSRPGSEAGWQSTTAMFSLRILLVLLISDTGQRDAAHASTLSNIYFQPSNHKHKSRRLVVQGQFPLLRCRTVPIRTDSVVPRRRLKTKELQRRPRDCRRRQTRERWFAMSAKSDSLLASDPKWEVEKFQAPSAVCRGMWEQQLEGVGSFRVWAFYRIYYCDDNVGYCDVKKGRVPLVTMRRCRSNGMVVSWHAYVWLTGPRCVAHD